jgi:hypothetical protein
LTRATAAAPRAAARPSRRAAASALILLAALAGAPAVARAEGAVATRRLAVVVGANAAAPGRYPLRFAQGDATSVAQVLRDQAGFAADDVRVLLDPSPAQVLAALDHALDEAAQADVDTLVLFYYSGHADSASLYPSGRTLPLAELRRRLDDGRAAMRIGIIDACHGGGWTGSKGLSKSKTFDIQQAFDLATEGSVLIASSSGLEDAHESLSLRGSFFTHHWNAALRGAGDRNGDDKVTVGEAFEYARALTIRDTALETEKPQHPSFRFNLRGRGDPPLAELSPGSSVIELSQVKGPLQIIHLGTGLLVVELPRGKRRARVSLSPGHYLVRRRVGRAVMAREVRLGARRHVAVAEATLVPVGLGRLDAKGAAPVAPRPPPALADEAPASEFLLSFIWGSPAFDWRVQQNSESGPYWSASTLHDTFWGIQGSYLMRHGRYLGTQVGAGFVEPLTGDGSLMAVVGEALSWPLHVTDGRVRGVSNYAIEPYVAAQLNARAEIERGDREIPYQVHVALAGGVRFYALYLQLGYTVPLLPREVTFGGAEELSHPTPGLAFETGFRLVKNFH